MPDPVSWLRLYHSILDNRKTGSLSRLQFGQYITLLLLASRNKPRGILPDYKTIAKHLGAGYSHKNRLESLLLDFRGKGLLDKKGNDWVIHNFSPRQWLPSTDADICDDKSQFDTKSDSSLTLCQDSLSYTGVENKDVMGSEYTKTCITEADKALYIYYRRLYLYINNYIRDLCRMLQAPTESSQITRFLDVHRDGEGDQGFRLTSSQTSVSPKGTISRKLSIKRSADKSSITTLWNSLPGIMHHKRFTDADDRAIKLALERFGLEDILTAIRNYSCWRIGAAEGLYRGVAKWSLAEFLSRYSGGNIRRLSCDDWADSCQHYKKQSGNTPVTVDELLRQAERKLS